MRHNRYDCNDGCPVEATLDVIGGKWKGAILYHLMERTYRYGELLKAMPSISKHVLTAQLRELEADGLIHREVYASVPPKVEYSLTDDGESLREIITSIREWGKKRFNL